MKVYIIQEPDGMDVTVYSTQALAEAYVLAHPGAYGSPPTLMLNSSGKAQCRRQTFFELEGASVGDKVFVHLFFSDLSGESFIGGAFLEKQDAEACKIETYNKNVPAQVKRGSGEIYVLGTESPLVIQ
jgi:hypothetical protein